MGRLRHPAVPRRHWPAGHRIQDSGRGRFGFGWGARHFRRRRGGCLDRGTRYTTSQPRVPRHDPAARLGAAMKRPHATLAPTPFQQFAALLGLLAYGVLGVVVMWALLV